MVLDIITYSFPLLSWLIWLPIAGAVLVLLIGDERAGLARWKKKEY